MVKFGVRVRKNREPDYVRWSLQRTVGPEKGGVGTTSSCHDRKSLRTGNRLIHSEIPEPDLSREELTNGGGIIQMARTAQSERVLELVGDSCIVPREASWRARSIDVENPEIGDQYER